MAQILNCRFWKRHAAIDPVIQYEICACELKANEIGSTNIQIRAGLNTQLFERA